MQYVHRLCYEEVNEECSRKGHVLIATSYEETMQCVKDSFDGPNMYKDDNVYLKADLQLWKTYGHGYWPSIVIN